VGNYMEVSEDRHLNTYVYELELLYRLTPHRTLCPAKKYRKDNENGIFGTCEMLTYIPRAVRRFRSSLD
jgi:hypothetical protein